MIAVWAIGALVVCGLLWWARSVRARRSGGRNASQPLIPESLFKIVVTESEIIAHRPEGTIQRCAIGELRELYIVTTSLGPWSPDVWWLFVNSAGGGCSFPQGATGEDEALQFAQQLPGFDNAAFISAMGSTSDAKFLCWRAAA
ncbi:MAG TPA: hypothetical protein VF861_14625 [Telluria sp.]